MDPTPGRLVVVGTPIGNLSDLSPRAAAALASAAVIYAEDTRRTGRLLQHLGVSVPMRSSHEHNERHRCDEIVRRVAEGDTVVLVSDAGMPGVSDPGQIAVAAVAAAGHLVEVIPGPAAAVVALVASGLATDRFTFEGFLPRKGRDRADRLAALASDPRTLVFYVSPHRAEDDLRDLAATLGGDRPAALARELTKLHEEVVRATLDELTLWAAEGVRGEVTLVVSGREHVATELDPTEVARLVADRMASGESRKAASRAVAADLGLKTNEVYEASLGS